MKKRLFSIVKYIAIFSMAVIVGMLLLTATAKIPQAALQPKMEETAAWMKDKGHIEYLIPGIKGTQLHYSADAIWLSIAYDLDNQHPLVSSMWAYYSTWPGESYTGSFYQSVLNQTQGDQQYLRYWHGSAAIIRFVHLFWNVRQIYLVFCVLITALTVTLLIMLSQNRMYAEVVSFILAMIMVSIWIVPLCLEYVWMFLVMLVASIIAVRSSLAGRTDRCPMIFFLTGITAAYLDFLTTETITLLIPLLLFLRVSVRKEGSFSAVDCWKLSAKSYIAWLIGFLGMWVMKWVIASIVLGENVMPYVTGHIEERLGGNVGLSLPAFLFQAVARNVGRLFIFDYGIIGAGVLLVLIVLFVAVPVGMKIVRIRKDIDWKQILLYTTMGLVPYIRYLILHNHSYGHYCFTYRAQVATILALCFIIIELVEPTTTHRKAVNPHGSDNPHALPE